MEIIELIKKILDGNIVIIRKIVKSQKFSGVIYLPKEYQGKRSIVIIDTLSK